MRWEQLLFLHWPVPAEHLRRHVPDELELQTFDGYAWLGVVPFVMAATRFRRLPPMPTAHRFAECNLRTYVRRGDRPGVWFFSLDAASRLAVLGARIGFGLPYFHASMHCRREGERVHYRLRRRDRRAPAASLDCSYAAVDPAASPVRARVGTLEHFLVERYCLYAVRRGRLLCGEIAHAPWQLTPASYELRTCDMARLVDCPLADAPASAWLARPVEVAAFSPELC